MHLSYSVYLISSRQALRCRYAYHCSLKLARAVSDCERAACSFEVEGCRRAESEGSPPAGQSAPVLVRLQSAGAHVVGKTLTPLYNLGYGPLPGLQSASQPDPGKSSREHAIPILTSPQVDATGLVSWCPGVLRTHQEAQRPAIPRLHAAQTAGRGGRYGEQSRSAAARQWRRWRRVRRCSGLHRGGLCHGHRPPGRPPGVIPPEPCGTTPPPSPSIHTRVFSTAKRVNVSQTSTPANLPAASMRRKVGTVHRKQATERAGVCAPPASGVPRVSTHPACICVRLPQPTSHNSIAAESPTGKDLAIF